MTTTFVPVFCLEVVSRKSQNHTVCGVTDTKRWKSAYEETKALGSSGAELCKEGIYTEKEVQTSAWHALECGLLCCICIEQKLHKSREQNTSFGCVEWR